MRIEQLTRFTKLLLEDLGKVGDDRLESEIAEATGGGGVFDMLVLPRLYELQREFELASRYGVQKDELNVPWYPTPQVVGDGWTWFCGVMLDVGRLNGMQKDIAENSPQLLERLLVFKQELHLGQIETFKSSAPGIYKRRFSSIGRQCRDLTLLLGWYCPFNLHNGPQPWTCNKIDEVIPAALTTVEAKTTAVYAWRELNLQFERQLNAWSKRNGLNPANIVWHPNTGT